MKSFSIVRRAVDGGDAGGVRSLTVLDVRGRITVGESSRELRRVLEELAADGSRGIALDVASVSHLDSSGLGSLLVGHNALKTQGGSICLLRAPQHIRELLELCRLNAVFPLFETEAEAAEHYRSLAVVGEAQ